MPEGDSVFRFAAKLRTVLEGQPILAARSHGPGPVPQVQRIVGAICTAVRSQGKNMLISFDNGLVLRGHLRMNGTWHIYRPGEAWRWPEREARLVLEVDGATVVNFSAPVIELLEERALAFHRPVADLGPDLGLILRAQAGAVTSGSSACCIGGERDPACLTCASTPTSENFDVAFYDALVRLA